MSSSSTRFVSALHILALVAGGSGEPVTSEVMAVSVNTNPVVIRRLLSLLRDARLVTSQGGPGGGWKLYRPARGITLRDVYRAVEGNTLFAAPGGDPSSLCAVGAHIHAVLHAPFESAMLVLEEELSHTTIADLLRALPQRATAATG